MKNIVRIIAILLVSISLGIAAYAIVQPVNPSVSLSQTAAASAGTSQGANGARSGAGYHNGKPQGGAGIAAPAQVLGKFLAAFIAVAALRALVGKVASRKEKLVAAAPPGAQ